MRPSTASSRTGSWSTDRDARCPSRSATSSAPQDLIQKYGADIVRLWVASLDYRDDDPISEEILARCAEAYRKIRNTARYLISNLYDFDPATDALPAERLQPLDLWALGAGPGRGRGGSSRPTRRTSSTSSTTSS